MSWGVINGLLIAVLILLFIGICWWAWLPARKSAFDDMAKLPLNDGEPSKGIRRD